MTQNVIVVAGGKGLRMGHDLPKQFIVIGDLPVLMHTIKSFYDYDPSINIIVVLPVSHQEYWMELCKEYNFTIKHSIANGGETRFHSVKNGLQLVKDGFVAVHDGARPFASKDLIKSSFNNAQTYKAVIPVTDVTDSLRKMTSENDSVIIDRSEIKQVQTPQVFEVEVLKQAYNSDFKDIFTDDASVVEANGGKIHLIKGEVTNIKITTPFDLEIANLIINRK